jgi:hypothetical protein
MHGKPSQLNYEGQEKKNDFQLCISNTEQDLRARKHIRLLKQKRHTSY